MRLLSCMHRLGDKPAACSLFFLCIYSVSLNSVLPIYDCYFISDLDLITVLILYMSFPIILGIISIIKAQTNKTTVHG